MEERPPSPHDPEGRDPRPFEPGADEPREPSGAEEPFKSGEPSPPPPPSSFEPPPPSSPPPLQSTPAPLPDAEQPIPWEQKGLDFFSAFYETLRLVLFKPRNAFARLAVAPSFARPLGFAILVGWPGILAATLWDLAFSRYLQSMLPMGTDQWERSPAVEIGFALAAPLWLPIALFLGAVFQHLFLMMVGAGKRGFVATFRVLCYAQGASLFGLIPLIGGLLSLLWHVVLQVVGLSAVHRVGVGRVLLAVILPLSLCCACAILLVVFGAAWLAWLRNG